MNSPGTAIARVEGATPHRWPRDRSVVALLDAYVAAATDLAAAHDAGIAEHDFAGYCAPEMDEGEPGDPRSDQFAWCASLYEALYGVPLSFGGAMAGALALPSRGPAGPIPRAVRRVLRRGLSLDPADRFESIGALLLALK